MAIDQRILDQMKPATPADIDYGNPNVLPPLTGSPAQIKWAVTIRQNTLALVWPEDTRKLLRNIVDSTWWIANKAIVNTFKFKPPGNHQLASNTPVPQQPDLAAAFAGNAERSREQRADEERLTDAERFAESVSRKPALAKATVLAIMSRLYKDGNLKTKMRKASRAALAKADITDADAKDLDAIERMLQ